jgi:hypothetical protein
MACSELNPSVTTFVFDADVTRFCSNFTVSEELAAVDVDKEL